MIEIPAQIRREVEAFMTKARRQLLWPDGTFAGHIKNRQAIVKVVSCKISRDVNSIIDIGCGLAVITAAFAKEFSSKTVHLIDGNGEIDLRPSMNDGVTLRNANKPWANVNIGKAIVENNCQCRVFTHGCDDDFEMKADLVVSTRALTHHFPLITYASRMSRWLSAGGFVFLETLRDVNVVQLFGDCGIHVNETFELIGGKQKIGLYEAFSLSHGA